MHCLCRACDKQLWRVAEWLVRKRTLVPRIKAARVVEVAAVAVQAVEVAWAAVDLPAAKVVAADAQVVVAVDKVAAVSQVAEVVAREAAEVVAQAAVVVDKVVAEWEAAEVVVAVPAVAEADRVAAVSQVVEVAVKVVEGEADAPVEVGADRVVVEWEAAAVVAVAPVVAGAAGIAKSSRPAGRQLWAPRFFLIGNRQP